MKSGWSCQQIRAIKPVLEKMLLAALLWFLLAAEKDFSHSSSTEAGTWSPLSTESWALRAWTTSAFCWEGLLPLHSSTWASASWTAHDERKILHGSWTLASAPPAFLHLTCWNRHQYKQLHAPWNMLDKQCLVRKKELTEVGGQGKLRESTKSI